MLKEILLLIIGIFIGLTSCSTGTNSSVSSPPNSADTTASIQISTVSTIPAANFTIGENVPVNISNNTDETITLQGTQLAANRKTIAASTINTHFMLSNCQSIAPHSSCTARAFTNPTFQSYLLNLIYSSSSGKTYQVNQVISFNKLLPVQNGFIYDVSQLNSNFSGLTIPFRLATDYSKITVLVNDQEIPFSCYKNNYSANTMCRITQPRELNLLPVPGLQTQLFVLVESIAGCALVFFKMAYIPLAIMPEIFLLRPMSVLQVLIHKYILALTK